jgi:hypothetical protein
VDSGWAVVVGGGVGVVGTLGATVFASLWGAHLENKRFKEAERNARHARVFRYRRKWYQDFVKEVRHHLNHVNDEGYVWRDEQDDFFDDFDVSMSQLHMYGSRPALAIADEIRAVILDPSKHHDAQAEVNRLLNAFINQMRTDLDVDQS